MISKIRNGPQIVSGALLFAAVIGSTGADMQLVTAADPAFNPPASTGGDSMLPIMSEDGRFVLFAGTANNLAATTNGEPFLMKRDGRRNVFLRDRNAGTTKLVSADIAGSASADADCFPVAVSANGRFALFESDAANLVASDTNGFSEVFLRDLVSGTTRLVGINTNGRACRTGDYDSVMSRDGCRVAFCSHAEDLVTNDTNGIGDVFVRDLETDTTTLVSVGAKYASLTSRSYGPKITPDGRHVLFYSTATNLVAGVRDSGEIYDRDLLAETTYLVSANAHSLMTGAVAFYNYAISDDGQYAAFEAKSSSPLRHWVFRSHVASGVVELAATNAVSTLETLDISADGRFIAYVGSTNTGSITTGIYVWDAQTATAALASVSRDGSVPTNSTCDMPILDASGRYLSFICTATNMTTNTVASSSHLYVRDLQAGVTVLVDAGTNGAAPARDLMDACSLSANGRIVAFNCASRDLVANDDSQFADVFVRDLDAGATELVSARDPALPSQTSPPGQNSGSLSVSADGRYAAFASRAYGLVGGYTNRYSGVFVNDLLNGTNILASVDTNGLPNANGTSTRPVISGDGRYVAFNSFASNLAAHDTNGAADVFLRDLQTGATSLISMVTNGFAAGVVAGFTPSVSADGRYVLFCSQAINLVGAPVSGKENLFLRDCVAGTNHVLTTGMVSCASMTPDGRYVVFIGVTGGLVATNLYVWESAAARRVYTNTTANLLGASISPNGQMIAYHNLGTIHVTDWAARSNKLAGYGWRLVRPRPRFSADGRLLVFSTDYPLSYSSDTNSIQDVYLYDFNAGTNCLISGVRYGNSLWTVDAPCESADISADGRFVIFATPSSQMAASNGSNAKNVFLHDVPSRTTSLLSACVYAERSANQSSVALRFTGDGQTVVFQSWASDLIEGDFNQGADVFVVKLASGNPIAAFSGQIIYVPGSGQLPTILWPATNGVTYEVQFKDELTDANWQPINGSVTVVGNQASAVDLAPNPSHRFYRIVAH